MMTNHHPLCNGCRYEVLGGTQTEFVYLTVLQQHSNHPSYSLIILVYVGGCYRCGYEDEKREVY